MLLAGDVRVGDGLAFGDGVPLPTAARPLLQRPVEVVKVVEVLGVPGGGLGGPCAFETARNRVLRIALAGGVLPAKALLLDGRAFRFGPNVLAWIMRTMALAERMATRDERERLFIVHRHAAERLANVASGGDRIWLAVGASGFT